MEFQKSFSPTPSAAVTDAELYRLCPVYRVSWWYNILRVRPIRRTLGGRLKETRGDRLAQTAIINRAAVPVPFPRILRVTHDTWGTRGARKTKPQISGGRWAISFLASFKSDPRYFPKISQRAYPAREAPSPSSLSPLLICSTSLVYIHL